MAYLHPIISGKESRPNLTILVEAWVSKVNLSAEKSAESITLTLKDGKTFNLPAKEEIILCGGAIDTPKLLLHSGIGPKNDLESVGIKCVHDLPGVGENLLDHAESIIIWELNAPMPPETTMHSDAGLFVDRDGDGVADLMFHTYQVSSISRLSRGPN